MAKFRFEDLEIWGEAIRLASIFFQIATEMEERKLWRFADQLRGVRISIPNNIAESTGTLMIGEQRQLLRVAKKECYEGANMMVILQNESLISSEMKNNMFEWLDVESRRIQAYSNSLK